jgi:hypothetical protein
MAQMKYLGKRTHQTYYICDHNRDGLVVEAYRESPNGIGPLRELVARASFRSEGQSYYSAGSHVQQDYRRDGLMTAMYDHLIQQGHDIKPADGTTGDPSLQVQSQDGKAFWAARNHRASADLIPCSPDEFDGAQNPFRDADTVLGMPVHQKLTLRGYRAPLLVLWGRHYSGEADQRVGVSYTPSRGYQVVVLIGDPESHDALEDMPYFNGRVRYQSDAVSSRLRGPTADEVARVCALIAGARQKA